MRIEGSSHGRVRYPEWQKTYHDALLELNPQKLVQRVNEAETAILSRLQEIRFRSDSRVEVQAIEDAINGLRVLKNERVIFKSSQSASDRYNTIGPESD
jgi:hypothetical protein